MLVSDVHGATDGRVAAAHISLRCELLTEAKLQAACSQHRIGPNSNEFVEVRRTETERQSF